MPDETSNRMSSEKDNDCSDSDLVIIDKEGDVVLNVVDDEGKVFKKYRVSSELLQKRSKYYKAMLAVDRFSEGSQLQSRLQFLSNQTDGNFQDLPIADLPTVHFPEIDQLSRSEVTVQALEVLLLAIHGTSLAIRKPDVNLLAHITVLAEQIMASECIGAFIKRYLEGLKLAAKLVTEPKREKWRQMVYLGYVFDDWRSFAHYTALLINWGPSLEKSTVDQNKAQGDGEISGPTKARITTPWQVLPADIEGKLTCFDPYSV